MSEKFHPNNPEQNSHSASAETETFVPETVSMEERQQIGLVAEQERVVQTEAKRSDIIEARTAVKAAFGEDIVDSYKDANGRTWVEDSQGKHQMLKESEFPQLESSSEKEIGKVDYDLPHVASEALAAAEEAIVYHKAKKQTPEELPVVPEEAKEITPDEPYTEDTAVKDLEMFGLDDRSINLILDVQDNFQEKDFGAFLEPAIVDNLMKRSGVPEEKRAEFAGMLEKVHTGLAPQKQAEIASENSRASEKLDDQKSEGHIDVQVKLAELSDSLGRVGALDSGRMDPEIRRDVDRRINEAVEGIVANLRDRTKRGETIDDNDREKRAVRYLRDIDTRFNADDISARLKRISQLAVRS